MKFGENSPHCVSVQSAIVHDARVLWAVQERTEVSHEQ